MLIRFYLCIVDVRACKALLEQQDLSDLPKQPDLLGFVFITLTFYSSF